MLSSCFQLLQAGRPNELLSRIQMKEVVRMARMVPMGMDLWGSRRSPDLLEPAMIPGRTKANTAEGHSSEPPSLGRSLNHSLDEPTCDGGKVDPHQQGEVGGDVIDGVMLRVVLGRVLDWYRGLVLLLYEDPS